jgi:anti-sigma factor RsiW
MNCQDIRRRLQDAMDGRLPPAEAAAIRGHLDACGPCAEEETALRRVGEALRLWTAAHARDKAPQLAAMGTRVRAGIEDRRSAQGIAALVRRWFWAPAAVALAVLALLFYPSGVNRTPFHPLNFDVSVEKIESDTATVALVDKGDDLPRVIWIIEDEDGRT